MVGQRWKVILFLRPMLLDNSKYALYGKSVSAGLFGLVILIIFYWLIIFLVTGDPRHPFSQFIIYKYWMSALFLGFGIQAGLFWFARQRLRNNKKMGATVALGGGTGVGSMVLCCTHHLAEVLPFLGLSAAALFFSKYQTVFFSVGVLSNLGGMAYIIYILKSKIKKYE